MVEIDVAALFDGNMAGVLVIGILRDHDDLAAELLGNGLDDRCFSGAGAAGDTDDKHILPYLPSSPTVRGG